VFLIDSVYSDVVDDYYLEYSTSQRERIGFRHAYFDELSGILLPGYDIRAILRRQNMSLRETGDYSAPTLLLGSHHDGIVSLPRGVSGRCLSRDLSADVRERRDPSRVSWKKKNGVTSC